jgi:hypothetical protein
VRNASADDGYWAASRGLKKRPLRGVSGLRQRCEKDAIIS